MNTESMNLKLNLIYPLLKRYYYDKGDKYTKTYPKDNLLPKLGIAFSPPSDEEYAKSEKNADEKATQQIKKFFPEFEKMETDI